MKYNTSGQNNKNKWENVRKLKCNAATTKTTRTGGLTNLSRLPSPIFNILYAATCLHESDYCKDYQMIWFFDKTRRYG
jgi:hypothetical protein